MTPANSTGRGSGSSIAVLPFANACDNKEQQYFAEGIAHNIAMDLSRNKSLVVKYADWFRDGVRSTQNISDSLRWLAASYAQVGDIGKAGNQVERLLKIEPGFTLSGFTSFFKDPLDNEHLREGLAKSGFPE